MSMIKRRFLSGGVALVIALACVLAFARVDKAEAGTLYTIVSDAIKESDIPISYSLFGLSRVDLDVSAFQTLDEVSADLCISVIPEEGWSDVFLYDGQHMTHARAEIVYTDPYSPKLRVTFKVDDLRELDKTTGLYLIIMVYPPI